ncbi:hypothetical protein ACFT5C_28220 [Streptomyces sp. NPDC057116]|uniref:hypothetical protein n=1 Tax=Streptomyces sp. NPDC057116 TaxID=3346023 RepID=UPI003633B21E
MSYNQPGPYGGQPQQPGPYGQPPQQPQPGYGYPQQAPPPQGVPPQGYGYPQQPGPYGQPPQQPYGAGPGAYPPPPPPAPKKKTGLIIGAVAVVAAIGVGAYFVFGGGAGADIADDGPHKLVTPETVLSEYKKDPNDSGDGMSKDDLKDAEKWGVKNAKSVGAAWQVKDETNPLAGKMLNFQGVYGEIADPEKVIDSMFVYMQEESKKEADGPQMVGSPKAYEPAELSGAVMKCQEAVVKAEAGSTQPGPKEMRMQMCVWGDHSTMGWTLPMNMADVMAGKATSADEAASLTAKLRKEVRVKA